MCAEAAYLKFRNRRVLSFDLDEVADRLRAMAPLMYMSEVSYTETSLEYELLTLFSRTALEEVDRQRAREVLRRRDIRWVYLMRIAGYHGVQPLLYNYLRRVEADLIDEDALHTLRAVVGARSAHSMVLERELGRLAGLFAEIGVPLLAIKGPVLAQSVYKSIALRPFVDLDLVIRHSDFERVEELLSHENYASTPLGSFQKSSYLFIHGQYTFWRRIAAMGATAIVLDIHTAIMPPGYSYTEDFDDLYARSIVLSMAGTDVHALEREDLLQVLCYHGLKNRWDRLKYICDVAEFLRAYPDLDWDTVYARAQDMHSERVLRLGLLLAYRLLRAPLPSEIERDVLRDHRAGALAAAIMERLPRQAHTTVEPYLDRVRLNVLSQDGLVGGLRYGAYAAARRVSELYLPEND